tara:strand:+ start:67 stop:579 length:513 start_codon:yes stop_codon:yes gene_type:complete
MIKNLFFLVIVFPISIFGQDSTLLEPSEIQELIPHSWTFEKALDENGIEVNEFVRKEKNKDGTDFTYQASHPPMTINSDFSYQWHKGGKYESSGTWRITKKNEIEFTLITKKGSRGFPMMEMAEKMFDKKLTKNEDGSYIDVSKYKIIAIDNIHLTLLQEDRYPIIFVKE